MYGPLLWKLNPWHVKEWHIIPAGVDLSCVASLSFQKEYFPCENMLMVIEIIWSIIFSLPSDVWSHCIVFCFFFLTTIFILRHYLFMCVCKCCHFHCQTRKYKPLHLQSMTFPSLCYRGRFSPFESPPPPQFLKQMEQGEKTRYCVWLINVSNSSSLFPVWLSWNRYRKVCVML